MTVETLIYKETRSFPSKKKCTRSATSDSFNRTEEELDSFAFIYSIFSYSALMHTKISCHTFCYELVSIKSVLTHFGAE